MEAINSIIGTVNGLVWSPALVYLCLLTGLYFSIRTGFLQARMLKPMVGLMFQGKSSEKGISSFQALTVALSGRIGVGNIAGVATAIYWGGPGALFWMWAIAFLGASSAFVEAALAQLWKVEIDGQYRGGPAYYIEKGMGMRWFAVIFAVCSIISCGVLLPGVQSNAIATGVQNAFSVPMAVTGAIIAGFLALIIFGGIKRIAKFAEIVVPFMAVIYILLAVIIVIVNIGKLPAVISLVFGSAFNLNSTFGGILGSTIAWGVKRGIYSNEAGQGTAPHAAAGAEVSHPAKQGLVQAFSVYIDTLFVCSATGFMILMTNSFNTVNEVTGNIIVENVPGFEKGPAFTQIAVNKLFHGANYVNASGAGAAIVAIALAFFAFTTLLAYYYISECNVAYIFKTEQGRKTGMIALKVLIVAFTFISCVRSADAAWDLGDIGVGTMAWLNIIVILILQKPALALLKDYEKQVKEGKDPVFNPNDIGVKDADLWHTINKN